MSQFKGIFIRTLTLVSAILLPIAVPLAILFDNDPEWPSPFIHWATAACAFIILEGLSALRFVLQAIGHQSDLEERKEREGRWAE
jgi:hypothetical protein